MPILNEASGIIRAPAPAPKSRPPVQLVWNAVRKHRLITLAVTLVVVLGAAFYTMNQKRIYRSKALIQFEPTAARPLGNEVQAMVEMGSGAWWNSQEYYRTQFNIIRSARVSEAVVRKLGLNHDAAFLANASPGQKVPEREVSVEVAANALRARINVEPIKDSRLASIIVEDADPQRAQRLLTAIVDEYLDQNLNLVTESTTSAVDWLGGQLTHLKKDLETSEMSLHEYKEKNEILSVSLDDQSNMLRTEMEELSRALTEAQTRRERLNGRRKELAKLKTKDPSDLSASELLGSVLLQQFRGDYVRAKTHRDELLGQGKGVNHPEVVASAAAVNAAQGALNDEVKNIQRATDRDYRAVATEISGLSGLLAASKQRAMKLNLLEIQYNRLKRTKENNEKLYSLVLERSKEGDLTRMLRFNNIHVVDAATTPKAPVRPRQELNLAIGVVAGLLLGIGAAISRELLDRSIKTPEDVEEELNCTFLGLLPALAEQPKSRKEQRRTRRRKLGPGERPPELVVVDRPTSGIAEAARALRTNLMFMSPDDPFRTVLVTSAAPYEGKTMVATCIAVTMAQAGLKTVLIDADMRRPRVHRVFDMTNDRGLTSALLDPSILSELPHDSGVPNLSVISSGPIPPNPAELVQSERFAQLLKRLQQQFDRIIIDSPPVVPVTDAVILSTRADATVLVVRAFETSKEIAKQAVRSIVDVGGNLAGSVLNAVDLKKHEYNYGYEYYQYKREGYHPEDEAA